MIRLPVLRAAVVSGATLGLLLASPQARAYWLDFDDLPETPAMATSPSHTDTTEAPLDHDFRPAATEFTDLSYGSFNGIPVAPAWSGNIAMYIDPQYQNSNSMNWGDAGNNTFSTPYNSGMVGMSNMRVYAPLAPEGTQLTLLLFAEGRTDANFWAGYVDVPAVTPGHSPWVFVSLPTIAANTFLFMSNTPVFIDHVQLEPVPEPETWALMGMGLLATWLGRKRLQGRHSS